MNNDLISRDDLINAKPEFLNETVVHDTKYQTAKARIYARAWNACNSYWLNIIKNAPAVEAYAPEQIKELVDLNKKLSEERPQGEWIRLDLAKKVIAKFEGYLDDDMIARIQIALEKENEADMRGIKE